MNIFSVTVKGEAISVDISTYGQINFFQPNYYMEFEAPKLAAKGHTGVPNIVLMTLYNTSKVNPTPLQADMYKLNGDLNTDLKLLIDKNNYQVVNNRIHLVNIYRWYASSEIGFSTKLLDNNIVIKEWNAARGLISYEDSKVHNFIPNIQNNPSYNEFTFKEVRDGLGLELLNEELINRFGNRYIYHSITPYAISGKIGEEYYSNAIYFNAPRIEIKSSTYQNGDDKVRIEFINSIDNYNIDRMIFNESLGDLINASILEDTKTLVLQFDEVINSNVDFDGNQLNRGDVKSTSYGWISIWNNDIPNSTFIIKPIN